MKYALLILSLVFVPFAVLAQPKPEGCGINRSCRVFTLTASSYVAGASFVKNTNLNTGYLFSGDNILFYSNAVLGATVAGANLSTPGSFTAGNGINLNGSGINFNNEVGYVSFNGVTLGGRYLSNVSAANAGTTPTTAAHQLYPSNALTANDWVFSVAGAANVGSLFVVDYEGDVTAPATAKFGTGTGLITLDGTAGIGQATLPGGVLGGTTTFSNITQSVTNDATVTATLPANIVKSTVALTAGDAVWGVRDSSDQNLCRVLLDGTLTCAGGGTFTGTITSGANAAIVQDSETRDVASIAAGDCAADMTLGSLAGRTFEAGDACTVGFALSVTGGLAGTIWKCWPSASNQISLRVCCNAAGAACNPASQTVYYTTTCADGNCN